MSQREDTIDPEVDSPQRPKGALETDEEAVAKEGRVGWGKVFAYLIGTIVGMFLLLVLLDRVVMPWYVKLGAVEIVPNVVGMPYAEAQKRLDSLGFQVKKGEPRFDDRYPAGTVIMQLPYGGAQTKEGRRIYLTLSRGTEMVPIPDLLGMPVREGRVNLMRSGFEIGEITYEHNDTIMKDLIYAQSIPPKVGARPGTIVDVMISRGPSTRFTMMPNLLSLELEQARARIENAGLVLGVVSYKDDPSYIKNTVIEQGVSPYSQVKQGAAVNITICGAADSSEGESIQGDEEGEVDPSDNLME